MPSVSPHLPHGMRARTDSLFALYGPYKLWGVGFVPSQFTTSLPRSQSDGHLVNRFPQEALKMAGDPKRAKLMAEITELQILQMESNREATFGGWTRVAQEEHDRRADHIKH
jgi:hypothetical protein